MSKKSWYNWYYESLHEKGQDFGQHSTGPYKYFKYQKIISLISASTREVLDIRIHNRLYLKATVR